MLIITCSEHNRHQTERAYAPETSSTTTGATSTTTTSTGLSSTGNNENLGSSTTGHHYGRDAAIGAGAGAAGAGLASRGQHGSEGALGKDRNTGIIGGEAQGHPVSGHKVQSGSSTTHDKTHDSHEKSHEKKPGLLEKIKSAVGGKHNKESEHHGATTEEDPATSSGGHRYGRDAAVVGGAGAVGGAAYETEQHRHGKDSTVVPQAYDSHTGTSRNNPTSATTAHAADPSLSGTSRGVDPATSGSGHHYGREAAVVGGTAGAGGAAYEAEQRHKQSELERQAGKDHKHHDSKEKSGGLFHSNSKFHLNLIQLC